MAALSRLTALTFLELCDTHHAPPAALATLTGLRHLNIMLPTLQMPAQLEQLSHFVHLKGLSRGNVGCIPPALGSLTQLERLCILNDGVAAQAGSELALPLPHSLRSLRFLCLNWCTAAAGAPALAAMPALEELYMPLPPGRHGVTNEVWVAFWAWAVAHPPLRRLCLNWPSGCTPELAQQLLQVQRRRPALHVDVVGVDEFPRQFMPVFNPY